MIDNYTLKARVYPILILFFPFAIIGLLYSIEFKGILVFLSSIGIVGALTYLFSQIGRDKGKSKESKLWQKWGGAPTIQLIRHGNNQIDSHTKARYRQKLQLLCPVSQVPDEVMEADDPDKADEVYKTWTRFLIARSRDPKNNQLLFKENISYGFRRNLWGLKPFGIILTTSLLIGNYAIFLFRHNNYNPLEYSKSFQLSQLALFAILLFWIIKVNHTWVRIPAFSYAERLYESLETP